MGGKWETENLRKNIFYQLIEFGDGWWFEFLEWSEGGRLGVGIEEAGIIIS